MKKFIAGLMVAAAALFSAASFAAENPYEVANSVAAKTFGDLKASKDKLSDPSVVNGIIQNDLMPYVDVRYAAYKVIGPSLKETTKEERDQFTAAFGDYLMRSMSNAIGKYTNQELENSPVSQVSDSDNIVPVKYTVKTPGQADISFIIKMRLNRKTGEWKAFDLIAENVSILDSKQAELSPIIKSKGIKAAITALEQNKAGK
ncbi:MAG: ABC transporter substrate-binding protein [Aeromonadales bacterium]|nr:ABC transporter substrate-binding protein [Aeromonadales bacterium]